MAWRNKIKFLFESTTQPQVFDVVYEDETRFDEKCKKVLHDFLEFSQSKLNISEMPSIQLTMESGPDMSSACYKPISNEVKVLAAKRALVDILRSIAHELVHRQQDEEGRLDPTAGAQEGNPLADVGVDYEDEANAKAGALIKEFSRLYDGLEAKEIYML